MPSFASLTTRLLDAKDAALGRRDRLTPPRRMTGYVGAEFRNTGDEMLKLIRELASLEPGEQVLDVGCGIGRVARTLASYLRSPGAYDGFDVVGSGVEWCSRRYTDLAAPFRFTAVDVENSFYNPGGSIAAAEFAFPYDDARFDIAIAVSVFTHLRAADADRYLTEAARVLRPGGRLFATFFSLTDRARVQMADTPKARQFTRALDDAAVVEANDAPAEAAVAYEQEWIADRMRAHGLDWVEPLVPGWWSGDRSGRSYQDIAVVRRA